MYPTPEFYRGKRVLITGHTGFKGSWICKILAMHGAEVIGYALKPPTKPSLFEQAHIAELVTSVTGDIRDLSKLSETMQKYEPEIVIHMAAQPIVREGYANPVYTYETNVMGTVNVLECIRTLGCVKSFLNVTSDKVYKNNEWEWGYRENEPLDGFDPYSNSKSCSELVTHSYRSSFFSDGRAAISTARAGNVIGGGDYAAGRIIPDCVRAAKSGKDIIVRSPNSTRPYQHVLEPLFAYLMIAQKQYDDISAAGWYNVGPEESDCVTTGELVRIFCEKWGNISWKNAAKTNAPHEANFLKLDCSKLKAAFGWKPLWHISEAVEKTVEWNKAYLSGEDAAKIIEDQIRQYEKALI